MRLRIRLRTGNLPRQSGPSRGSQDCQEYSKENRDASRRYLFVLDADIGEFAAIGRVGHVGTTVRTGHTCLVYGLLAFRTRKHQPNLIRFACKLCRRARSLEEAW